MQPFAQMPRRVLARCPALLSDVDGTLTTGGELEAATVRALEQLRAAGVPVILVTGRPAGYAELMTRYLPVLGTVAENGGLWFVREPGGALRKRYSEPDRIRRRRRARLLAEVEQVLAQFPGARLSTDSAYTEVDLAIDYAEEAHLDVATAQAIELACLRRGLQAVRSSVHVNVWASPFDKRTASLALLREALGLSESVAQASALYVGDSFNDAPMFDAFTWSVGVGQLRDLGSALVTAPRFVTTGREAAGARQVLAALSRARRRV